MASLLDRRLQPAKFMVSFRIVKQEIWANGKLITHLYTQILTRLLLICVHLEQSSRQVTLSFDHLRAGGYLNGADIQTGLSKLFVNAQLADLGV